MPSASGENRSMTLFEKTALFEKLSVFPALTLMVITRSQIGYRLIHPVGVAVITAGMWMISLMVDSAAMPRLLYYHAWVFAIMAGVNRFARRRDFRRGVKQHSYYLGTSVLDYPWLGFIHRHRLIARWLEPALWGVAAFMLFQKGAKAEALWVAFSAFCLRTFEEAVHRKERDRNMDMIDGLVMSEVHSGTVEQFCAPVATAASAAPKGGAISTGISPELKELMARRSKPAVVAEAAVPEPTPLPAKKTRKGVKALTLAIALDSFQLAVGYYSFKYLFRTHPILLEYLLFITVVMNVVVMVTAMRQLRFHWLFLLAALIEYIPFYNLVPLWTICVAWVAWQRRESRHKPTGSPPPAPENPSPPAVTLSVVVPQDLPFAPLPPAYAVSRPPPILPPEAVAQAPEAPSASLFRSREGLVIAALVVPTVLLSFWLLHGLRRPEKAPHLDSGTIQLAQVVSRSAQRRVTSAKRRCDSLAAQLAAIADPGPEPDWYYFIEHGIWAERKQLNDKLAQRYHQELDEAQRVRKESEEELASLSADLSGVSETSTLRSEVTSLWSTYIVPPLHVLLAFSLVRFSARAIFRFLLLKDQIGAIRL